MAPLSQLRTHAAGMPHGGHQYLLSSSRVHSPDESLGQLSSWCTMDRQTPHASAYPVGKCGASIEHHLLLFNTTAHAQPFSLTLFFFS